MIDWTSTVDTALCALLLFGCFTFISVLRNPSWRCLRSWRAVLHICCALWNLVLFSLPDWCDQLVSLPYNYKSTTRCGQAQKSSLHCFCLTNSACGWSDGCFVCPKSPPARADGNEYTAGTHCGSPRFCRSCVVKQRHLEPTRRLRLGNQIRSTEPVDFKPSLSELSSIEPFILCDDVLHAPRCTGLKKDFRDQICPRFTKGLSQRHSAISTWIEKQNSLFWRSITALH